MTEEHFTISFHPSRVSGRVRKGTTVLEAARLLGIGIEGPCSGLGRCAKDMVQVRSLAGLATVLACKTPVDSDMEVMVPCRQEGLKSVTGFFAAESTALDPAVRRASRSGATDLVYIGGRLHESCAPQGGLYAAALDIGTTTLAASLIDLETGSAIQSTSTLNPLVHYGHDVMSRIRYSSRTSGGLERMHRDLISSVNMMLRVLVAGAGADTAQVYQLAAAGNTTMQHIFLNKPIDGIGEFPYRAQVLDTFYATPGDLGLELFAAALVSTMPCISAYVGGDIVSGLLGVLQNRIELPALLLDIGTNGEIALIKKGGIVATSTAAGPCFEGMTISSGMRASDGAIEHVKIDDSGHVELEVIGSKTPVGICGSGLFDLVSELIRTGLVSSRGRLQSDQSAPEEFRHLLFEKDGRRGFRLSPGVAITQDDIRQVQLAKAAIRAGVELLLSGCGVATEEIKQVVIAGGFGYHLKEESIAGLGILPGLKNARTVFAGNSSLGGAQMVLVNKNLAEEARGLAGISRAVDLSQDPSFEAAYLREMRF